MVALLATTPALLEAVHNTGTLPALPALGGGFGFRATAIRNPAVPRHPPKRAGQHDDEPYDTDRDLLRDDAAMSRATPTKKPIDAFKIQRL